MAARCGYQEVRGEVLVGKVAWAHSVVNRLKSNRWGLTLKEVVLYHDQYSAMGPVVPSNKNMLANFQASMRLLDDDPQLLEFAQLVQNALNGEADPTGGATHYFNPKVANPSWAKSPAIKCGVFGTQEFWKNVP
jgi:N-acetylmuramoyl-L-alanine amidase